MYLETEDLILDFAIKWVNWGGGSEEDIMVTFGLTRLQFYARLEVILDCRSRSSSLEKILLDDLYQLCDRYIRPDTISFSVVR